MARTGPDTVPALRAATRHFLALGHRHPSFAHYRWKNEHVVHRVVRWVNAVRKGKPDRKIINFPAEFVPGGSTGPVGKG